jgi:hypothetical protein
LSLAQRPRVSPPVSPLHRLWLHQLALPSTGSSCTACSTDGAPNARKGQPTCHNPSLVLFLPVGAAGSSSSSSRAAVRACLFSACEQDEKALDAASLLPPEQALRCGSWAPMQRRAEPVQACCGADGAQLQLQVNSCRYVMLQCCGPSGLVTSSSSHCSGGAAQCSELRCVFLCV